MVEPREGTGFGEKLRLFLRFAQVQSHHLQRNPPVKLHVAGRVDDTHPAGADLLLDLIAVDFGAVECL
jgi:hypothetical protein